MTRVLLILSRGEPMPASPEGVTLSVLDLPPPGSSEKAARATAEAMRTQAVDAVVLADPGDGTESERNSQLTALLKAAPVPSVLCSPRNLHRLPAATAGTSPMDPASLATAVVHGFGARSLGLAVRTAAHIVRPQPES